jgi:hypothetical protein
MANAALFVGWNRAVAGREQQAMDLFGKVTEYYTRAQSEGKIESFEPVLLAAHGGDLNGFMLVKGDVNKLHEFRREDTFVEYVAEAAFCLEGVGVIEGAVGERITDAFSRYSKLIGR